jgi:hypothetical protein
VGRVERILYLEFGRIWIQKRVLVDENIEKDSWACLISLDV